MKNCQDCREYKIGFFVLFALAAAFTWAANIIPVAQERLWIACLLIAFLLWVMALANLFVYLVTHLGHCRNDIRSRRRK